MVPRKSSAPDEPDLAILLVAAHRVLTDRLLAAMDDAGLPMRPAWGFVIRALHDRPLPLARLAELLDVTKQAAQQTVDEMQAAGPLTREEDGGEDAAAGPAPGEDRPGRRPPQAHRADRRGCARARDRAPGQRPART